MVGFLDGCGGIGWGVLLKGQIAIRRRCFPSAWMTGSTRTTVRVIDAFVDAIDLGEIGFAGVVPEATGRPIIPRSCSSSTSTAT
jgi:hypothetical protein